MQGCLGFLLKAQKYRLALLVEHAFISCPLGLANVQKRFQNVSACLRHLAIAQTLVGLIVADMIRGLSFVWNPSYSGSCHGPSQSQHLFANSVGCNSNVQTGMRDEFGELSDSAGLP